MTTPSSMHAMEKQALELLGKFSQVQDYIDDIVRLHLQKTTPELLPLAEKRWLRYMRDDDRVDVLHAVSKAVGSTGDLTHFRATFTRVKSIRDLIGHSANAGTVWNGKTWTFSIMRRRDDKRANHLPDVIDEAWFDSLHADCSWMMSHMNWIVFQGGLARLMSPTGNSVTPEEPTLDPPSVSS